jgi:hypothetical protein
METTATTTKNNDVNGAILEGAQKLADAEQFRQETEARVRGRKPKAVKTATKTERQELLRQRILTLKDDLEAAGFGPFLKVPGPVQYLAEPILDPKTKGSIAHVEEELATYIQRVRVVENFYQRQPFEHLEDKIYRRLIRDFIEGAAMPESKVAALGMNGGRCTSLADQGIRNSVIDGLQRLYCFCIALLVVWQREKLLQERCITPTAWEYLKDVVEKEPDPKKATEDLLKRATRYEIFWNIGLEELLHYMVTFNTGQRSMSVQVQLEIMRKPLLDALEHDAKITIFKDTENVQGRTKPKDHFAASDLVLATRAFIEYNPQLKKPDEAESLLETAAGFTNLQSSFDVGDVTDVVSTMRRIGVDIHHKIMERYATNPNNRYILSGGGIFLVSFAAACGKIRNMLNMTSLNGALERLVKELATPGDDPLNLDDYQRVVGSIKTSRGKARRRLVYDTFLRFFNGTTPHLDWEDAARQMSV